MKSRRIAGRTQKTRFNSVLINMVAVAIIGLGKEILLMELLGTNLNVFHFLLQYGKSKSDTKIGY
jgi:hypothetical protein